MRVATDKTVTRRYDLTRDDRLRNFVEAERITPRGYLSIAGWAFEGLRVDDVQKQFPIALPAIDARLRLDDPWLGGKIELQGNSLAILRIDGQDTQRAFASARWDLRRLLPGGQEATLTAFAAATSITPAAKASATLLSTRATRAGRRGPSARSPPTCATR